MPVTLNFKIPEEMKEALDLYLRSNPRLKQSTELREAIAAYLESKGYSVSQVQLQSGGDRKSSKN